MANVAVLASAATQILGPNVSVTRRQAVVIQNLGPNAIAVDTVNTVTVTNGIEILPNADKTLTAGVNGALFARAATADQVSPADTRILVEVAD